MKTYFRLLSFARPIGKYVTPYLLLTLTATLFGIFNITLLIPLLDVMFSSVDKVEIAETSGSLSLSSLKDEFHIYALNYIKEHGNQATLIFICILFVSTSLIANTCRYFSTRILIVFQTRTIMNLRVTLFSKILQLPISFFSVTKKGYFVSRILADTIQIQNTITNSFFVMMKEPFQIIGILFVMLSISVKLTLTSILIVAIFGGLISFLVKKLRYDAHESQKKLSNIVSILDETLNGIRVVKGFNAIKYLQSKFTQENQLFSDRNNNLAKRTELASPLSEMLGTVLLAVVLIYGGGLIFSTDGGLQASEFITYVVLVSQLVSPLKKVSSAFTGFQKGIVSGERIIETLDLSVEENKSLINTKPVFENVIEFKDVNFSYDNTPTLKDISFSIRYGESVALVGHSGSGKSTIADLLCGFYAVNSGSILVDGVNINEFDKDSIHKMTGVVYQESILFNDTVENNIAFGDTEPDLDRVKEAAKIALADEFISEMEFGYKNEIGERGLKLSGGQKQRICLARAIYKNPDLLILDEATSALDSESERIVQMALLNLMEQKTSLVIAHRLSTIKNADKIIVLDKGEIVGLGTHEELMKKSDVYIKLNQEQIINV